jgi:hypothetical protein
VYTLLSNSRLPVARKLPLSNADAKAVVVALLASCVVDEERKRNLRLQFASILQQSTKDRHSTPSVSPAAPRSQDVAIHAESEVPIHGEVQGLCDPLQHLDLHCPRQERAQLPDQHATYRLAILWIAFGYGSTPSDIPKPLAFTPAGIWLLVSVVS